ncbi:serine/threonine-protein kinase [Streptomyces sp. AF1A]|uniref:serine/threonine-protein kinase n=1 Tax=Streptomyces sp. AF1A TaxID=3394350 RepID=UPI0039BCEE6C
MQPLAADEPVAVGPYRLLGRLGSGGMGRVYLGRSAGGRTVAVKIVHPHFALDEEFRARFRREVEAARRVGGAWTAPVLDADPDAPVPWVATAYAAGPSLAAAVTGTGPLPAHTVRALGAGLAEALAAVHDLGLVHRDVKPSNVLLTLDGPLLIDFGIARATDGTASLTSTGVSIGSPGYMSPEQILGKGVTGAADVFSLGAVLAYAATGEQPFPGDSSAALLYKVVHEEPELGSLSGDVREIAAACLAKDPASRPAPADVSRRLAPEGAARLVAGGWLPGPLVEQVSRSAVHLLNLDSGEAVRSGPVPFSSPSVGGTSGAVKGASAAGGDGDAVAGEFGPAPVMNPGGPPTGTGEGVSAGAGGAVGATAPGFPARPADAPGGGRGGPTPHGSPTSPAGPPGGGKGLPTPPVVGPGVGQGLPTPPPVTPPGLPTPPTGAPGLTPGAPTVVPAPQDAARPGRVSVSVAASSTPGESGRGRRVSCTVALAVAGALAAVTVGAGALLRPWFDTGGGDTGAGSGAAHTPGPSAAASSGAADKSARPGAIPARYLGTWEGQATGLGGALPMGTFRLTVHQARKGEELGRLKQTDQIGAVCTDILTLTKVTKSQLLATSVGAKGNHAGCDPAPHQIALTPVGDDLRYTSDSAAEGNPEARLSKAP